MVKWPENSLSGKHVVVDAEEPAHLPTNPWQVSRAGNQANHRSMLGQRLFSRPQSLLSCQRLRTAGEPCRRLSGEHLSSVLFQLDNLSSPSGRKTCPAAAGTSCRNNNTRWIKLTKYGYKHRKCIFHSKHFRVGQPEHADPFKQHGNLLKHIV